MDPNTKAFAPSQRGLENLGRGKMIDMNRDMEGVVMYDPITNPKGPIAVSGAENYLMADHLRKYTKMFAKGYTMENALEYGAVAGPEELPKVVSKFINRKFNPSLPVRPEHILATNGVSSLLDMVAFNTCDQGEGIMLLTPTYSMYELDLSARAGATIIRVSLDTVEDQFSGDSIGKLIAAFTAAHEDAMAKGVVVKAVLICNPSNPLGRFYSRKTLVELAKFCGRRRLHFVADEIFAMSAFESPVEEGQKLDMFTSVLSIANDRTNGISGENIHCLYGASKDFGMGGLRLGFLITRNKKLWQTCRRVALFTWLTTFSTDFFTYFLGNDSLVDEYLDTFQTRLKASYVKTTKAMRTHGIPYITANGGFFVWIDLSRWLIHFEGQDTRSESRSKVRGSREEQLCQYLIKRGVYLSMGELSMSSRPGMFRFVYTGPGHEPIIAVERIASAVADLNNQSGLNMPVDEV